MILKCKYSYWSQWKDMLSISAHPYLCVCKYTMTSMCICTHGYSCTFYISDACLEHNNHFIDCLDADSHVCSSHSCSCVNPTENYCSCLRQSFLLLLGTVYLKKRFLHSESWNGEAFATRIHLSTYINTPCQHSGFSKFSIPFPDLEKKNVLVTHIHT